MCSFSFGISLPEPGGWAALEFDIRCKSLPAEAFLLGKPKFYVILAIELADVNLELRAREVFAMGNSVVFVIPLEITIV